MEKLFTYEELLNLSKTGNLPSWKEVSGEQLSLLYVDEGIGKSEIANLFNVSSEKVSSKRERCGIKMMDESKLILLEGVCNKVNDMVRERRLSKITSYKILFVMFNIVFSRDNFNIYSPKQAEIYHNQFQHDYNEFIDEVYNSMWLYLNEKKNYAQV